MYVLDTTDNGSPPDYEIIGETDPYRYYCTIEELDMLSNFNQELADHRFTTETKQCSASGHTCTSQQLQLDRNEFTFQIQSANVVASSAIFDETLNTTPQYRKTPRPKKRQLMNIASRASVSLNTSAAQDVNTDIINESKVSSPRVSPLTTQLHDRLAITPQGKATLMPSRVAVNLEDNDTSLLTHAGAGAAHASSLQESCDIEDALSIYDMYTI